LKIKIKIEMKLTNVVIKIFSF